MLGRWPRRFPNTDKPYRIISGALSLLCFQGRILCCLHASLPLKHKCLLYWELKNKTEEKMIQLKERISRNAVNIPKVVKRVQECIENIDILDSLDVTIHPAFRRRRIN